MESFWIGLKIGSITLLTLLSMLAIVVLIYNLARYNVFFTIVQEGTAKAILRFGKCRKIVMSYKGHYLDAEWNVKKIDESPSVEEKLLRKILDWIKKITGGLKWIGIPFINKVHLYRFEWTSYEQVREGEKTIEKPITKEEKDISFILVQDDVYFTFLDKAETKGMIPVDVSLLLTLRVVNPYKALFRIQKWLEATQNRVKPAYRSFTRKKTFEELTEQREAVEDEANSFLKDSQVDNFIKDTYGVELVAVEMVKIDPAGEWGTKFTEEAAKKWSAEKEKERIETLADADVNRMERVYGKITSYGEQGMYIRTVEAIEKTGQGPSNLIIFPFGSIKDIMKGWLGKEKEEDKK
ncbi:MAG: SPFH domain-containing protein [Patescibacteria group bacterium]